MSRTEYDPRRLDVARFAMAGASIAGQVPLQHLGRIRESLDPAAEIAAMNWRAHGDSSASAGGARSIRLHLHVDATLPLICQRCLTPLVEGVTIDRWFRFVGDERLAAEMDEESEDDVLVLSREFDLMALIEDELLMDWPVVPRHDICPETAQGSQVATPEEPPTRRPFADLARIRRT